MDLFTVVKDALVKSGIHNEKVAGLIASVVSNAVVNVLKSEIDEHPQDEWDRGWNAALNKSIRAIENK